MKLFDDLRNKLYSESPESRERVEEKKNKVVEEVTALWETDQHTMDPCVDRTWEDAAKEYNDRIKEAYKMPNPRSVVLPSERIDKLRAELGLPKGGRRVL